MKNLTQYINAMPDKSVSVSMLKILEGIYNRLNSACLSSAGLVISATVTLVKTGVAATVLSAQGVLRSIAGGTNMPVLAGTVVNATFNVFVFSVDNAGSTYSQMGTASATLVGVKWPNVPATRCTIGFIIVNPTGIGNFVGGTTPLGDLTVVPNVVYVNTVGAFDPNATIS